VRAGLVVLAGALSFASTAVAGDWRTISASGESMAAIDMSSPMPDETGARVSVMFGFAATQQTSAGARFDYYVQSGRYDCTARTYTPESTTSYLIDGSVVETVAAEGQAQPIAPETIRETVYKAMCLRWLEPRYTAFEDSNILLREYRLAVVRP
jgi:hypothetical protein